MDSDHDPGVQELHIYYAQTVGIPSGSLARAEERQWTSLNLPGIGGEELAMSKIDREHAPAAGKWVALEYAPRRRRDRRVHKRQMSFSQFASNQRPASGYAITRRRRHSRRRVV